MAPSKPRLYSSWHCPFAQRAWVALNAKNADFDLIEIDPYNKTPEFLAINPRGLVPTIVDVDGRSVYESSVCIEYVDERWPRDHLFLPGSPYDRAQQRLWGDHITKKIVPAFYALLLKDAQSARKQAADQLIGGLRDLFGNPIIASSSGPYLVGTHLSYADIMLAPFALRFGTVLKRYRDFEVPVAPEWKRYRQWLDAIKSHPSVRATLADDEKLIGFYSRYADNTAQSEVADAVRKGEVLP